MRDVWDVSELNTPAQVQRLISASAASACSSLMMLPYACSLSNATPGLRQGAAVGHAGPCLTNTLVLLTAASAGLMEHLMQAHSSPYDPAGANGALLMPPGMTVNVHNCPVSKLLMPPALPPRPPPPPLRSLLAVCLPCVL